MLSSNTHLVIYKTIGSDAQIFDGYSLSAGATLTLMGPCQITIMRLWPAADYEPYRGCMSIDGGLQLLHKAEDDAVKWLESVATTAFVK